MFDIAKTMSYPCKSCGVVLKSRSARNYHTRNKVCEKIFQSGQKIFVDPNCTGEHLRTQELVRCTFCSVPYSHSRSLTRHLKKCAVKQEQEKQKELLQEKERQRVNHINEMKALTRRYMQVEDDYTDQLDTQKEHYETRIDR